MTKGKFTVLLMSVLLLCVATVGQVQAVASNTKINDPINIAPAWENVSAVSLELSFSDGEVVCSGKFLGKAGTTSISATFKLEQKTSNSWTTVKTWSESVNGSILTFSGRVSATRGYTYRLSVTSTVIRNGVSETVKSSPVEKAY